MPYTVQDLFERASAVLNDTGAVRWPFPERLGWVNDGAIRICNAKPNANVQMMTVDLAPGSEQAIPAGTTTLVRAIASLVPARRAVTPVSRQLLDGYMPGWHDPAINPASSVVDHVLYDPADPDAFHVCPPNDGTGKIRAEFAVTPVPIAAPVNPDQIASYSMAIPLGDEFMGPLLDYLLYRAYQKDAAEPGAAALSAAHFQAFQIAIGEKVQKDIIMNVAASHPTPRT
ncbi:MAG: hypothetical protein F9K30_11995 [Dechloromonas sp.]|nr:MAG: hypothetical protein F9K30_11995 [Dechloromonas sp.]